MTAPAARYTPSKPGDSAVLDRHLTELFGPSDPATDAWIAAYDAVRRQDLAELERLSAHLQTGVADYERRVRELERVAGIGVRHG